MLIKKKSTFLIFDHTLSSIEGHSYNYVKNIFLESKKYFSKSLLYVNKDFFYEKKNFLHRYLNGPTNYFAINNLKKLFFKSFPKIQSNQSKKEKIRGVYKLFISIDYFLKFYNILKSLNKDRINYIYIQYFDETIFYVLRLLKFFNIYNNHIKILIISRYDLKYFRIKKIKKSILDLKRSKYYYNKITFFSDNVLLSKKNNKFLGYNIFKTLPLIVKHSSYRNNKRSDNLFNLSFVGPMRLDKGVNFIKNILKKYDFSKNKIRFNLQVNKLIPFNKNYFRKSINSKNQKNINLIQGPLSHKKYLNLIKISDAIFCPYENKKYFYSTSNIFVESLFLNIPIIFTKIHGLLILLINMKRKI